MAGCAFRWVAAISIVSVVLTGCGRKEPSSDKPGDPPPVSVSVPPQAAKETAPVNHDPKLHQTFAQATTAMPPDGVDRPPDVTMTGKSVGKLYKDVVKLWEGIPFVSAAGKPLVYRATLDTELGVIEMKLRPDWAPNHVRNFIALARAGYYDGLVFERTVRLRSEEAEDLKVDLIEAGCPEGTGKIGGGSIGYWLKPEFNGQIGHEDGTVGATHDSDPDTAACRFYITLCRARSMDGQFTAFGQVTRGLDIAHKVFTAPVRTDDEYPEGDRPEKPVVIRKVTIEAAEADK